MDTSLKLLGSLRDRKILLALYRIQMNPKNNNNKSINERLLLHCLLTVNGFLYSFIVYGYASSPTFPYSISEQILLAQIY